MHFGLAGINESRDYIKRRLLDGWVAMVGDDDAISQVEHSIYPPGTPKNTDFEMVGLFPFVFLAKKTDELRQLCSTPEFDEMRQLCSTPEFDDLAAIVFHIPVDATGVEGHVGWLAESIIFRPHVDKAAAADRLVRQLTEQWGDLDQNDEKEVD